MQHGIAGADHPAHTAHAAVSQHHATQLGDLIFTHALYGADVAGQADGHLGLFGLPELPLDHPHALAAIAQRGRAHVFSGAGVFVAELVALFVGLVVAEVLVLFVADLDRRARLLAVALFDLVEGQPASDDHVLPLVRVVALGVRVRDHVQRVEVCDADLAQHRVAVADADVEVAALLDQSICKNLSLQPVQAGVVLHMSGYFGQRPGQVLVGATAAGPERNVHAVLDLVADGRVDLVFDLVELQRRAAFFLQPLPVVWVPLPAAPQVKVLGRPGVPAVGLVPAHAPVLVALPVEPRLVVCVGHLLCAHRRFSPAPSDQPALPFRHFYVTGGDWQRKRECQGVACVRRFAQLFLDGLLGV